jgi:hypothetical protein
MEDFGYKKQKKNTNNGNVKKKLLAIVLSFAVFFWIVIKSYYFINNTNLNQIETIKAEVSNIKVQKPIEAEMNNNSIYEDILQKKGENIDNYQTATNIQNINKPSKINETENNNLDQKHAFKQQEKPQKKLPIKPQAPKEKLSEKLRESNFIKVQIAALSSFESAEEYWQKIANNQAKILKNYQHFIETIDLHNKGILFRLKIGDFSSKNEAENFCQQFILQSKKTKADCIILD